MRGGGGGGGAVCLGGFWVAVRLGGCGLAETAIGEIPVKAAAHTDTRALRQGQESRAKVQTSQDKQKARCVSPKRKTVTACRRESKGKALAKPQKKSKKNKLKRANRIHKKC